MSTKQVPYTYFPAVRDEDIIRDLAAMLASYAATGGSMVAAAPAALDSAIYLDITMNLLARSKAEHWKQPFSGCAYLCLWVAECIGFGNVRNLQRTGKPDNPLTRIAYHELSESISDASVFESGDFIQIGETSYTSHVYVCLADNESAERVSQSATGILGAHYGQEGLMGDSDLDGDLEGIGGAVRLLSITRNLAKHTQSHGKRTACRVLRVLRLLEATETLTPFRVPDSLVAWPGFAELGARIQSQHAEV